jgi:hypothetical protein
VIEIYVLEDKRDLKEYRVFDTKEIYGLCEIQIKDLLNLFEGIVKQIKTEFLRNDGKMLEEIVTVESFPDNWDNYQLKMARLIDKYLKGEKEYKY